MINDNGIAWMIAGGLHDDAIADQRQILHRIALAESTPSRTDALRRRIAGMVGSRTEPPVATVSTVCCPA
jgi:hypothetical protein